MQKYEKGDEIMLKDKILEKIFTNKETKKCPLGTQSTMVSVFTEVIEEYVKENPYATISELLSADE